MSLKPNLKRSRKLFREGMLRVLRVYPEGSVPAAWSRAGCMLLCGSGIFKAALHLYKIGVPVGRSLPRGGVVYPLCRFTLLELLVKAVQPLSNRRMYPRFFGRVSPVSLPALLLFPSVRSVFVQ